MRLGSPELKLPPVIHVAGTNGKGSCVAYLRAIFEAAGLKVHCYTSPHLVKFHERIRLNGVLIEEAELSKLLEECEVANAGEPITFFEITTAAAFLAFSRTPADYLILEVGLGGRLDATNMVVKPVATTITSIGLDHQQYLGDTLDLIATEKAGIFKRGVPAIVGDMPEAARVAVEAVAEKTKSKLSIANQDWQAFEHNGRMVFQDEDGLLDLPLPNLIGAHQINNAGNAIATIRALRDLRVDETAIEKGITSADWPARMQRLKSGGLEKFLAKGSELWLDGGHNPDAGEILYTAFNDLNKKHPLPLTIIWGMLNTKDAFSFIKPLAKLRPKIYTIAIPAEANAIAAEDLAALARAQKLNAISSSSFEAALKTISQNKKATRILICGSLYLAGHVLAAHDGVTKTAISGTTRS